MPIDWIVTVAPLNGLASWANGIGGGAAVARGKRRHHGHEHVELLALGEVRGSLRVAERAGLELDLDHAELPSRGSTEPLELARERVVEEVRVGRILDRGAVHLDGAAGGADQEELCGGVGDRVGVDVDRATGGRVEVEVTEEDVDRASLVELVGRDALRRRTAWRGRLSAPARRWSAAAASRSPARRRRSR